MSRLRLPKIEIIQFLKFLRCGLVSILFQIVSFMEGKRLGDAIVFVIAFSANELRLPLRSFQNKDKHCFSCISARHLTLIKELREKIN